MHKRFKEFQAYHKQGKRIFILFCLDLVFLLLTLIFSLLPMRYSQSFTTGFLLIDFILLFCIVMYSNRNISIVKNLEKYFLHNNYGTSVQKIKKFHKLIEENHFKYHFQPIINARTGDIYAYEALMRTDPDIIGMLPVEILDLAAKENRLYDIEKLTFYNTLKIMKDASDTFQNKKLFINSVSSHQLSDEDFDNLFQEYGPLFNNVVMELTESTLLNDAGIKLLHKRMLDTNCQLALDDYGTGYSNASILLNTNPNLVKIDRSILHNINSDAKKQHLVTDLVKFAKQSQIKVIAEGIETFEEFEYVINVGVDYIQGFYTAKPNPILIDAIPADLLETIHKLNCKKCLCTQRKLIPILMNTKHYSPIDIHI